MHWGFHLGLHLLVVVLILAEIILPSGGLITIALLGVLGFSWYTLLNGDWAHLGVWFFTGDLIVLPLAVFLGFRLLGKIGVTNTAELKAEDGFKVDFHLSDNLVGKPAKVVSPLRPSGKIEMEDGEVLEALSAGELLEIGDEVEILSVDENKLIVTKKMDES